MYTKQALHSFYPHLALDEIGVFNNDVRPTSDVPLYGDELDVINNALLRDPATGHPEELVSYVLNHAGSEHVDAIMNLIVQKQAEKSPHLSDEDLLAIMMPKNVQEAGEIKMFQQGLEGYLSSVIEASKEEPATPEPPASPSPAPSPVKGSSESA